jgi:tetratricopeptide (TPR) repeat protein
LFLIALCSAACRRGEGFSDVEQAAMQRAHDALRQGDDEQAAKLADGLAKAHPSASLFGLAGVARLRAGRVKEAVATLERAQVLDAANPEIALARVRAYLAADKTDKARDAARLAQAALLDDSPFSRAIALGGFDRARTADAFLRVGQELLRAGQSTGALGVFQEAVVLEPKLATAHLLVGSAFYNVKAYARAVGELRAAIELGAPASGAWKLIGHSLAQLGENRGALEAYTQVLRASPGDMDARNAIARLTGQPPPGQPPAAPAGPTPPPAAPPGVRLQPGIAAPTAPGAPVPPRAPVRPAPK